MKKKALLRLVVALVLSTIALQGCVGGNGLIMKPRHICADCGDKLLMMGSTKDHEICPVTMEPHRWRWNP